MRQPNPLISMAGIAANGCGLFVMPFIVGLAAAVFVDVSEVADTGIILTILALVFIAPALLMQLLGVVLKVGRERRYLHEAGERSGAALLASIHRHMRIVTPKGWAALFIGLFFIAVALSAKWASFGVLAVLTLLLFYSVLGLTSFLSTFQVQTFQSGLGRGSSGIRREMSPAVVLSGEVAEERIHLNRVPVPSGFMLLVEDENPPELGTESRYSVGAGARRKVVTLSGRFRRTPRGLHRLGPARISYQDAFGFTRVNVASMATANLKVLPRFRSLEIVEPPRSRLEAPDVLTRPHRYATEDYFRFKEYAPGMDTRRIHWRLSIRTGHLQVRQPETREISTRKVLIALDTYLPKGRMLQDAVGMGQILDKLVETWISLANELIERGDQVSMVTALDDGDGNIVIEHISCTTGNRRRWQDMGARACWQGLHDLPQILESLGKELHAIAVSSRFFAPPPESLGGESFTWVYRQPMDALGKSDPPFWRVIAGPGNGSPLHFLSLLFRLPAPVGSDENGTVRQWRDIWRRRRVHEARKRLRRVAYIQGAQTQELLLSRGETVYRLEPGVSGHKLVGLVGGGA
ncbi:MAG: hypothetical protein ACI8RZ_000956 [Myxococcota bacterium]|jgi:uncharacterized protein (DUF58 family)